MNIGEILRTDNPPVRAADDSARSCGACRFWSGWLPHTGDCMRYALQRRDALLAADDSRAWRAEWPEMSARATSDHETCDGWESANHDRS